MAELGTIKIKAQFDIFSDLLGKLSNDGLAALTVSIKEEVERRAQMETV